MINQCDIARIVGTDQSTVSIVLNGKAQEKQVSDTLAARIRAVAAEHGYRVNRVARSLVTGRTQVIALFAGICDITRQDIWWRLQSGVIMAAERAGYSVLMRQLEAGRRRGF